MDLSLQMIAECCLLQGADSDSEVPVLTMMGFPDVSEASAAFVIRFSSTCSTRVWSATINGRPCSSSRVRPVRPPVAAVRSGTISSIQLFRSIGRAAAGLFPAY